MTYPADDTAPPRTLKPEDTAPAVPTYDPKVPKGFQPVSKEDAEINADTAKHHYEQYRRSNTLAGNFIDEKDGLIYKWVPAAQPEKPASMSKEDWDELLAFQAAEGNAPKGDWVLDQDGQLFYDDWKRAVDETKQKFDSLGTARSYADIEAPKSKEVARQFQDFENRATLLYDLMADEQQYGMRADDQNIQNMSAQQELGLGGVPGGFYAKAPMSSALSNILAPSLPEYVRPDYRLNQSVGLPGPQGFDDQDYNQFGFPQFAFGTDPMPIQVPPIQIRTWPWGGR